MTIEINLLIFAAVMSAIASGAAWYAAVQSRTYSLGQVLSQLISDYGSTEMLNSLMLLREWKKNNGDDFAKILAINGHGKDGLSKYERKVNESRRRVFTFYETVRVLEKRKIITYEDDIIEIIGRYAVRIFFEIVEPIEYEMAEIEGRKYWKEPFNKFREWYDKVSDDYPKNF